MANDSLQEAIVASEGLLADLYGDGDLDLRIPSLARDSSALRRIESLVRELPTSHRFVCGDARAASQLASASVHLVVTSPPYWTLKQYAPHEAQLGDLTDYGEFI